MALYIINEGMIAGVTNDPEAKLAKGLFIVEGMDLPIEQIYFNGSRILAKPPKPPTNSIYEWDSNINSWEEIPSFNITTTSTTEPNWLELIKTLQESPVWAKVNAAGMKTIAANFAVTMLIRVLDVTHQESDLLYAFDTMREVFKAASGLEDFNTSELQFIQAALDRNNFTIKVV